MARAVQGTGDAWIVGDGLLPPDERGSLASTIGSSFFSIVSWMLAVWLVSFWSLVVRVRISLGEWPHPSQGNPIIGDYRPTTIDPKAFSNFHDLVIWMGLVVLAYAVPVAILVLFLGVVFPAIRPSRRSSLLFLGLVTVAGLTVIWDPFGFMLWFVD